MTHFDCNHLAHVIVLLQMQKCMCSCKVFALFYFEFEGNIRVLVPGGLYLEGRFIGGLFALRVSGAYIGRGSYMEGLIFAILRYVVTSRLSTEQRATLYVRRCKKILIR